MCLMIICTMNDNCNCSYGKTWTSSVRTKGSASSLFLKNIYILFLNGHVCCKAVIAWKRFYNGTWIAREYANVHLDKFNIKA